MSGVSSSQVSLASGAEHLRRIAECIVVRHMLIDSFAKPHLCLEPTTSDPALPDFSPTQGIRDFRAIPQSTDLAARIAFLDQHSAYRPKRPSCSHGERPGQGDVGSLWRVYIELGQSARHAA